MSQEEPRKSFADPLHYCVPFKCILLTCLLSEYYWRCPTKCTTATNGRHPQDYFIITRERRKVCVELSRRMNLIGEDLQSGKLEFLKVATKRQPSSALLQFEREVERDGMDLSTQNPADVPEVAERGLYVGTGTCNKNFWTVSRGSYWTRMDISSQLTDWLIYKETHARAERSTDPFLDLCHEFVSRTVKSSEST